MIKFTKVTTLILLFFSLSTYVPKHKSQSKSIIFPIEKIKIENNVVVNRSDLIKKLEFLKGKNLLFVDLKKIEIHLKKFDFISSFKVNNVYPQTINIIIFEKKPIAIYSEDKKLYYISEEGDLINYLDIIQYKSLPIVFGKNRKFNIF